MPTEWHDLRWNETKKAAYARGLRPPDVKGMSAEEREASIKDTVKSLQAWEGAWGEGARPAPELLDDEELAQEAAELGLELEAGTEPKILRARVREVHISRQHVATHPETRRSPSRASPRRRSIRQQTPPPPGKTAAIAAAAGRMAASSHRLGSAARRGI